jgi:hypothetical protein
MTIAQTAANTAQGLALAAQPAPAGVAPQDANGVASQATPNRTRKDDIQFKGFAKRMIRAYGRRAETADPWVVKDLLELREEIDRAVVGAVRAYRAAGLSWGEIGYELGINRVACFKRYAHLVGEDTAKAAS